jgi:hypothetical protein
LMIGNDNITLMAVGDVGPNRDDPPSIFEFVTPVIGQADIAFCQLERIFSTRGMPEVTIRSHHSRVDPKNVSALTAAGFHVVSFASNHSLDWGHTAFLDTVELLRSNGMLPLGVGKDIEEARKPVIVERNGIRVAFLGYCTVLPKGYDAALGIPGCTPLRARTFYEQIDWQAGTPPRIVTFTEERDLQAMIDDIKKVRVIADVVVVSMHWGVHFAPEIIAMYQREAGHAAIDAGADLILGHHAHILKGVEVYKNKVIFHSLGNFAFDTSAAFNMNDAGSIQLRKRYPWDVDPEYVGYGHPVDSRKTLITKLQIRKSGIERVSYLPAYINKYAQPEVLKADDPRFEQVVSYVEKVTRSQELPANFAIEADEVMVT